MSKIKFARGATSSISALAKNADTLYFGTGDFKKVYSQMKKNPNIEILALKDNEFLRYDGEVVFEEDNGY